MNIGKLGKNPGLEEVSKRVPRTTLVAQSQSINSTTIQAVPADLIQSIQSFQIGSLEIGGAAILQRVNTMQTSLLALPEASRLYVLSAGLLLRAIDDFNGRGHLIKALLEAVEPVVRPETIVEFYSGTNAAVPLVCYDKKVVLVTTDHLVALASSLPQDFLVSRGWEEESAQFIRSDRFLGFVTEIAKLVGKQTLGMLTKKEAKEYGEEIKDYQDLKQMLQSALPNLTHVKQTDIKYISQQPPLADICFSFFFPDTNPKLMEASVRRGGLLIIVEKTYADILQRNIPNLKLPGQVDVTCLQDSSVLLTEVSGSLNYLLTNTIGYKEIGIQVSIFQKK